MFAVLFAFTFDVLFVGLRCALFVVRELQPPTTFLHDASCLFTSEMALMGVSKGIEKAFS